MNDQNKDATITWEESGKLIAESDIQSSIDLGHGILYRLMHPKLGALVVLNSAVGASAMMLIGEVVSAVPM